MDCFRARCLILFLLIKSSILFAQDTGTPFITNYSSKDYKAHSQNWSALQDNRGLMYFANNDGVLTYDGDQWQLIEIGSIVRSLGIDEEGRVYVGAHNEFGYIASDTSGRLIFKSLLEHVPEQHRNFADVWQTLVTPTGVFYQTSSGIYQWHADQINYIPSESKIHISFWVNNQLYVKLLRDGMLIWENGQFSEAPNFDFFKENVVFSMLPFGGDHILLGTYNQGLKLYNYQTGKVTDFDTETNEFLIQNGLYHGIHLPDYHNGAFAFATLGNGVVVIDENGDLLIKATQDQGLQNDRVKFIFADRQHNLWLALNNGISKIEMNSPLKFYGNSAGIKGKVYAITRHQNQLLLGNPNGVYSWKNNGFKKYAGPTMQIWDWLHYNSDKGTYLLMGTDKGISQYDYNEPVSLMLERHVYDIQQSRYMPDRLLIGFEDGFAYMENQSGKWQDAVKVPEVGDEIRTIVEVDSSTIWLGTDYSGLIRLQLKDPGDFNQLSVTKFDTLHGLQDLSTPEPAIIEDSLVFFTSHGIKAFDDTKNTFVDSDWLGPENSNVEKAINYFGQDALGRYWLRSVDQSNNQLFTLLDMDGSRIIQKDSLAFLRLPEMEVIDVFHDQDSVSWIASSEGLYKFDPTTYRHAPTGYHTVISQMTLGNDSVIYHGYESPTKSIPQIPIPFSQNPMQFTYSAFSFENEAANQFSYMLEGSDIDWSPWTRETKVRYTNLWEGDYRFRVKSRNIYGVQGKEAIIQITVLPPFHRSILAYTAYVVLAILFIWFIVRMNVIRLKRSNERLESIVSQRVTEINKQKQEIEQQNEALEKYLRAIEIKNAELKAYDKMVSHDLKGPIGNIVSLAGILKDEEANNISKESLGFLNQIITSSNASNELIDGILSFASADQTAEMEDDLDLNMLINKAIEAHASTINNKQAKLEISPLPMLKAGISVKIYQLFYNLIGNALKFQKTGTAPKISIYLNDANEVVVQDNGIGFDQKYAEEVFKPLKRMDNAADYEGHGIGLGTCKRIVDYHGWTIRAESNVDKGAKFIISNIFKL